MSSSVAAAKHRLDSESEEEQGSMPKKSRGAADTYKLPLYYFLFIHVMFRKVYKDAEEIGRQLLNEADGKVVAAQEQLELETYRATKIALRLHEDKEIATDRQAIRAFWNYAEDYLIGYRLSPLPDGKLFKTPAVLVGAHPGTICHGCKSAESTQIFRGFGLYPHLVYVPFAVPALPLVAGDWLPPMCGSCCMRLKAKREYHHCVQQLFRRRHGSVQTMLHFVPRVVLAICLNYLYTICHLVPE